jgi:archaellum component FlaG (FlaF/FlaG flagellin family)
MLCKFSQETLTKTLLCKTKTMPYRGITLQTRKIAIFLLLAFLVLPLTLVDADAFTTTIQSPPENSTLSMNPITVKFTVKWTGQVILSLTSMPVDVFLDGQLYYQGQLDFTDMSNMQIYDPYTYGSVDLQDLPQGGHTVEISVKVSGYCSPGGDFTDCKIPSAFVSFLVPGVNPTAPFVPTVNRTTPLVTIPLVTIQGSDEYQTNQPTLNITTDMSESTVSYNVDDGANVTLPHQNCRQYNVTLTNLPDGAHKITAYAKDNNGKTGVAEKTFTTKNQLEQFAPFSIKMVITGIALAAIIIAAASMLVYNSKRAV